MYLYMYGILALCYTLPIICTMLYILKSVLEESCEHVEYVTVVCTLSLRN